MRKIYYISNSNKILYSNKERKRSNMKTTEKRKELENGYTGLNMPEDIQKTIIANTDEWISRGKSYYHFDDKTLCILYYKYGYTLMEYIKQHKGCFVTYDESEELIPKPPVLITIDHDRGFITEMVVNDPAVLKYYLNIEMPKFDLAAYACEDYVYHIPVPDLKTLEDVEKLIKPFEEFKGKVAIDITSNADWRRDKIEELDLYKYPLFGRISTLALVSVAPDIYSVLLTYNKCTNWYNIAERIRKTEKATVTHIGEKIRAFCSDSKLHSISYIYDDYMMTYNDNRDDYAPIWLDVYPDEAILRFRISTLFKCFVDCRYNGVALKLSEIEDVKTCRNILNTIKNTQHNPLPVRFIEVKSEED